jgi:U4/U6.U5 tri-snRNP-associated protein 1
LNRRLAGATLGDADTAAEDTLSWIKKSKKREKELAKKRQQEQAAQDSQAQEEYTESQCYLSVMLLNPPC